MNLFKKVLSRSFIRKVVLFGVTGGIATLIDLAFFNLFFKLTSVFVLSRILGILISIIFNFNFNRNVTFRAKDGSIGKQGIKFLVLYGISMSLNVLVSKGAYSLMEPSTLSANIAAVLGLAISIPVSFFGALFWVFRKPISKKS
ncbi:MAG: GtrA family protein [Nanoarchaeota archaeon]|nr:GtrA family protein [Nanoarchaeota archaeon]